jgi:hypothetical protein
MVLLTVMILSAELEGEPAPRPRITSMGGLSYQLNFRKKSLMQLGEDLGE